MHFTVFSETNTNNSPNLEIGGNVIKQVVTAENERINLALIGKSESWQKVGQFVRWGLNFRQNCEQRNKILERLFGEWSLLFNATQKYIEYCEHLVKREKRNFFSFLVKYL